MSPRKLRVLGLHGWRTSGSFLQWQTEKYSGLTIHLSDLIEVATVRPGISARVLCFLVAVSDVLYRFLVNFLPRIERLRTADGRTPVKPGKRRGRS